MNEWHLLRGHIADESILATERLEDCCQELTLKTALVLTATFSFEHHKQPLPKRRVHPEDCSRGKDIL